MDRQGFKGGRAWCKGWIRTADSTWPWHLLHTHLPPHSLGSTFNSNKVLRSLSSSWIKGKQSMGMEGRAEDETQQDWNELPHPPCSKLGGSSSGNKRYSFSNCHLHTLIDKAANKVLQCSVGRLRQHYLLSVTGLYRENWDRLFQPPSPHTAWEDICTDVHQKTNAIQALVLACPHDLQCSVNFYHSALSTSV